MVLLRLRAARGGGAREGTVWTLGAARPRYERACTRET